QDPDHRYSPARLLAFQHPPCMTCWPPSPCTRLSRARTTTRPPPHSQPSVGIGPARHRTGGPAGRATADGSHVHCVSLGQVGAQLYPGSIAAPTPQAFSTASSPSPRTGSGVDPPDRIRSCTAFRPVSARFEPEAPLRGFNHWFTRVTPSDLASRTRAVWQYQPVPTLSRLLSPSPAIPGSGCLQLHQTAATARRRSPSISARIHSASWRTDQLMPVGGVAGQPGALQAEHDPGPAQRHLGDQLLEAFPVRGRCPGLALVDVDHGDLVRGPAERDRLAAQVV